MDYAGQHSERAFSQKPTSESEVIPEIFPLSVIDATAHSVYHHPMPRTPFSPPRSAFLPRLVSGRFLFTTKRLPRHPSAGFNRPNLEKCMRGAWVNACQSLRFYRDLAPGFGPSGAIQVIRGIWQAALSRPRPDTP
jgi:hypothetical protein